MNTESDSDVNEEFISCCNCHRYLDRADLKNVSRVLLRYKRRKKYFNIRNDENIVNCLLCKLCIRYLLHDGSKVEDYWPAMIWTFLFKRTLYDDAIERSLFDKWRLIPAKWRYWWIHDVQEIDDRLLVTYPDPAFVDVTDDYNEFNECIRKLKWRSLAPAIDKFLAIPTVRCPWGCGTFLHTCNKVSLEEFMVNYSNFSFDGYYKGGKKTTWVDCIRPDFPEKALILECKKFECYPSIIFDEGKPSILCCANHNSSSTKRYIHIPKNPTGSIFCDKSNQYSQAVIKSRTLRKTKQHTFCDTYQTGMLQGGFDGIDSSYLTSSGCYVPTNELALERDALTIAGRDDMRSHVLQLSTNVNAKNYVPRENVEDKMNMAKRLYPEIKVQLSHELSSGTFIKAYEAVLMQDKLLNTSSRMITVYEENGSNEEKSMSFQWPAITIGVHPNDSYGERFPSIGDVFYSSVNTNNFAAWVLLGCIGLINEIWQAIDETIKDNVEWKGDWLSLVYTEVFLGKRSYNGKWIFNKRKARDQWFLSSIGINLNCQSPQITVLNELWNTTPCISTMKEQWIDTSISDETQVVILLRERENDNGWQALDSQDGWILRLVIGVTLNGKEVIYARHNGFRNWWVQHGRKGCFMKCKENVLNDKRMLFQICVYTSLSGKMIYKTRDMYLKCLGIQSSLYCECHKFLLVVAAKAKQRSNHSQRCCGNNANSTKHEWKINDDHIACEEDLMYICPEVGCKIGVCKQHFLQISSCSENKIYCISQKQCRECTSKEIIEWNIEEEYVTREDSNENFEYDDGNDIDNVSSQFDYHTKKEYQSTQTLNNEELGPQVNFEKVEDMFDDMSVISDSESVKQEIIIPATNCAEEYCDVIIEGSEEVTSSPLHVLLNQQGHLLIRKNAKLRMQKRAQQFYQRIVATSKATTIPLVYAEGMLFSDIFYYSNEEGSILGAIPTALLADDRTLSRLGIAPLRDHFRTRINDPSLLSSTDPRYHFFSFDNLVNLAMRGEDSRLVLHRGFADSQPNQGIAFRQSENGELYGDTVENQTAVHKLAAAIGEHPAHYFYTRTLNQKKCRGVRILREWVTSEEAIEVIQKKYCLSWNVAATILRESAASYVQKSWDAMNDLWMRYIIFSSEEPLGKIWRAWMRKEFQKQAGNPSHTHSILWSAYDVSTPEGLHTVLDKIRGSLADIVRYEELEQYVGEGLLSSLDCFKEILEDAAMYLPHTCSNERCQVPTFDGENGEMIYRCKVPNNFLLSPTPQQHTLQEVNVIHNKEACDILLRLGLAKTTESSSEIVVTEPLLQATRHLPISSKSDGKFSATNGRLFVMDRCASNLQYPTGHTVSLYLTKYVTEIDEVAIVLFKGPETNEPNTFRAKYQSLNNTKINSVKYANEKTNKKGSGEKKVTGRPLTQMECLTIINGTPLVTSTIEFIHIPTCAREYRSALDVKYLKLGTRPADMLSRDAIPCQTVRTELKLSDSRLFMASQLQVIRDERPSSLTTDKTTYFSMRPPELRFIRHQALFYKWFDRRSVTPLFDTEISYKYCQKSLSAKIENSEWLDGFCFKIVLRCSAIEPCLEYAKNAPVEDFGRSEDKRELIKLLKRLFGLYCAVQVHIIPFRTTRRMEEDWNELSKRFLCEEKKTTLPVVWITPIAPRHGTRFLIHLLLTMGSFCTEYDLMLCGNLRTAFQMARLFDPLNPTTSVLSLLKRYVMEMLRIVPGSTIQFDRHLCYASTILHNCLLQQTEKIEETPAVLYSHMQSHVTQESIEFMNSKRKTLTETLLSNLYLCGLEKLLPDESMIMNARSQSLTDIQIRFYPPPCHSSQPSESFEEQFKLFKEIQKELIRYMDPTSVHRNVVIVGGPGTGKTTVSEIVTLYALCKGLNGLPTTEVAERAKQLGGLHIHALFALKVFNNNYTTLSPGHIAQQAIRNLYRNPMLLSFLRSLDFIFFDEFGLMSAERLAVIDLILRYVHNNNQYMGGLFIFSTMDVMQLLPWSGTPMMISINAVTNFMYRKLSESVRASQDSALREIQDLTRCDNWNEENKARFSILVREHFTFVNSFDDPKIPTDAVFVFGRKKPCEIAEQLMLKRIQSQGRTILISQSMDEESTTAGNWRNASQSTKKSLSKSIKQRQDLGLYLYGRYEFTHNEKNKFSQGQLGILLDMPSKESIACHLSIKVWAAPPGTKQFPSLSNCTKTKLISLSWKEVTVRYTTSPVTTVYRGIQARRTQYGLKPRVASTIHASMGCTLSSIVTTVIGDPTFPETNNLDFKLWEAALVVVLLSRTRFAKQEYFVGDPEKTISHLLEVLQKPNPRLPTIKALLSRLCEESTQMPVLQHPSIYRPQDATIGNTPCVYLLVSTAQPDYIYIGSTINLAMRLYQHNSGQGSQTTQIKILQPWALMCYVVGFADKEQRLKFEAIWKFRSRKLHRQYGIYSNQVATLGIDLGMEWTKRKEAILKIINCGSIST
jgi:predicted GIY-YIG superfamily endonuclease